MDSTSYFINQLSEYPVLGHEEQMRLVMEAQNGNQESRNKLIKHNTGLVMSIAKKYQNRMDLEDLFQSGIFGLHKAIDRFEVERGFQFSTLAYYWILQAITKEINDNSRVIRVPSYLANLIPKVKRVKEYLESKDIKPTAKNIAKELDEKISKVEVALELQSETLSLNFENSQNDDFNNLLEQNTFHTPEEKVLKDDFELERKQAIMDALNTLRPEHKNILIYRFGLDNNGPKRTLEEVADMVGLTKERVRQIEKNSLQILRNFSGRSNRRKRIREFV